MKDQTYKWNERLINIHDVRGCGMSFDTQHGPLHTLVILQTVKMFIGHLH